LRKIKGVSLLLLATPILFTGCMQEKISQSTPIELRAKKVTTIGTEKADNLPKEKITLTKNLPSLHNQTSKEETPTDIRLSSDLLNELALEIQKNISIDLSGSQELASTAIELQENESLFTKEDEILETAKEFLGVKYIWAANGPSAFDCSGYTKYVFKRNGITLPRYSGHQAKVGIQIQFDELEKGDLVFFDTEKHPRGKVNHVGIYIGNNQFIHASSAKKKVIITSFTKKRFYKKRFLHGQRIVDSNANFASYQNKYTIQTN